MANPSLSTPNPFHQDQVVAELRFDRLRDESRGQCEDGVLELLHEPTSAAYPAELPSLISGRALRVTPGKLGELQI